MRFWSNGADSGGLCAPGTHLAADSVVTLDSGWRHYDAPLRCVPGAAPLTRIGIDAALLGEGWSVVQGGAVWNERPRATLRITLPAGRRVRAIGFDGYYHYGVRSSRVSINGVDLGTTALGRAPLPLPASLGAARVLDIRIERATAPRPASATDTRALGFLLRAVQGEFRTRSQVKPGHGRTLLQYASNPVRPPDKVPPCRSSSTVIPFPRTRKRP